MNHVKSRSDYLNNVGQKPREELATYENLRFKKFFGVPTNAMVKNPNKDKHGKASDNYDNYVASKIYQKKRSSKDMLVQGMTPSDSLNQFVKHLTDT